MNGHWWQSKTKVGSLLVGGGMILSAAGAYVLGDADLAAAVKGMGAGLGVILVGFGIRNALK
jgi:hypothetical protein